MQRFPFKLISWPFLRTICSLPPPFFATIRNGKKEHLWDEDVDEEGLVCKELDQSGRSRMERCRCVRLMKGKFNLRRPAWLLARSPSRKHGVTWPPLAQTHALQTHVHTPTPAGGTRSHSRTKCQHKHTHTHTHTHSQTHTHADYMTAPWLPSRARLMPAEVSR